MGYAPICVGLRCSLATLCVPSTGLLTGMNWAPTCVGLVAACWVCHTPQQGSLPTYTGFGMHLFAYRRLCWFATPSVDDGRGLVACRLGLTSELLCTIEGLRIYTFVGCCQPLTVLWLLWLHAMSHGVHGDDWATTLFSVDEGCALGSSLRTGLMRRGCCRACGAWLVQPSLWCGQLCIFCGRPDALVLHWVFGGPWL